jgi:type IV pilus assembly protein PilO
VDISLSKLPWYGQVGAFVLLAAGGAFAFWRHYETPMREEMATRQAQLTSLQAGVAKGLATAQQLPKFRGEVERLEERLSSLRAVLPEEKDAADLLRRMQTVAVQSNLAIRGFTPAAVVTRQLHAEWPITLELDGTYHNLATFLDRLGKFTRIVNVTNLEIAGKTEPGPNSTITARCVATTFVLLDEGNAPAAPRNPS